MTSGASDYQEAIVKLKELPSYGELKSKVNEVVKNSSLWEIYGIDWTIIIGSIAAVPAGLMLLRWDILTPQFALGIFLFGCIHAILADKASHLAAHGALSPWKRFNKLLEIFFEELCGSFSAEMGYEIHIKVHHPHTNIIGLGDSSSWKAPFLSRYTYMFFAPLLLPALTPLITIGLLRGRWLSILRMVPVVLTGIYINAWLLVNVSGFSWLGALACMAVSRSVLAVPYIHVNIFQHIGLPMWDRKHRPKRIYQMSMGVLNLSRNPILDVCFGHSLINCHVEHHLFNELSDNMCLKIKPLVSKFLRENNLAYTEKTYMDRLYFFVDKYEELMVKAPPITHFVGIQ